MDFPISLSAWTSNHDKVIGAIFADDGPIASLMPDYRRNPTQVKYAKALAAAVVRGVDPDTAGRITAIAAGTGVGKSIAILIVSGINAALQGKRSLVTTYTRQLNRQLNGKDGRLAERVIGYVTGNPARIALRRPRSAFADVGACRRQADLIIEECIKQPYGVERRMEIAEALRALADWAESEGEAAMDIEMTDSTAILEYVQAFRGLIESFFEIHPAYRKVIEAIPYDLYTLDSTVGLSGQAPYLIYKEHASGADVLIATHAALIRDQSLYGIVLDPSDSGYSSVIADEAHLLEKAGMLALGTKRAISSYSHDVPRIRAAANDATNRETKTRLLDLAEIHETLSAAVLAEIGAKGTDDVGVTGEERWVSMLEDLHRNSISVINLLKNMRKASALDLLDRMNQRHADVDFFLDVAKADNSAEQGRERFYKARLSFSPRNTEPSITVTPKHGARILSRLWSRKEGARADAIILTSATLGRPQSNGKCDTTNLFDKVGAGRMHADRINTDLEAHFEVANLGFLDAFLIPHPSVPAPHKRDAEDTLDFDPAWFEFATSSIVSAAADHYKLAGNRVVVLCTSFEEADRLAAAMPSHIPAHRRERDENLDDGFDWLATRSEGVLFTVGAHDGVDRPGLIDHLIMPRLPFRRPSEGDRGRSVRDTTDEMMMMLQQGFGRAFRSPVDRAKVWILDPRIGIPAALSGTRPHPRSKPYYLDAIPSRFRFRLAEAVLLRLPENAGHDLETPTPEAPAPDLNFIA